LEVGSGARFFLYFRRVAIGAMSRNGEAERGARGRMMGAEAEIARLIEPSLAARGYELVRVRVSGGRTDARLQVMAERKDRREMTVEDCATISRELSAILDVADPLPGAYTLEVSSPGIDRPLVRLEDFARFKGQEARIETARPVDDARRRFRGVLGGVVDGAVMIEEDGRVWRIPFDDIERAKLVLTDALIAASLNKQSE
jgi:ribosome maturation factor RimP